MKRLTITGNLGRDPEMRIDPNGHQFATFSVGINVGKKGNPRTDWIDVSCNGQVAEFITTYGRRGNKVLVDGFPHVTAYINKENVPVGTLRMYANTIELLGRRQHDEDEDSDITSHHTEGHVEYQETPNEIAR